MFLNVFICIQHLECALYLRLMFLFLYRTCGHCQRSFATEAGLKDHIGRMKGRSCGIYALLKQKQKQKQFFKDRRKKIKEHKLIDLAPLEAISVKKKGPLKTEQKEDIVRMVQNEMAENGRKRSKAIKEVAKIYGRTISIIRSVLKEKQVYGNVIGGPYSRMKKSTFEKLDLATRDALRGLVHEEMRKCKEKTEGARYPTVESIHAIFMDYSNAHPELPKWCRITSYHILEHLGFMHLENKNIHYGLLVDNEYTIKRRAYVCQEFEKLEGEGWYLVFLDESYINVGHSPKKHWHDTTVHTAKEALEKGLSTGTIKPPGRGERLILIGNLIFF